MLILSIDPGNNKCGIAIMSRTRYFEKHIIKTESLIYSLKKIILKYKIEKIILGNGTGHKKIEKIIKKNFNYSLIIINEKNSTLEGRKLFFTENPPKGIKRLLPKGLLIPNRDYDDYVAIIIGKRFFDNYA